MNRFKNILAVYSDSLGCDDVIGQAGALALANDARLTLVFDARDRDTPVWRMEMHKRLRRVASMIERTGVQTVETRVINGAPAASIVREVIEREHDLVIMSSKIGDTFGSSLLGGTLRRMMRHCSCPVWFLAPGQKVPFASVLAVVDPCATESRNRALNRKVMEMSSSLARSHDATLHLVHAWDLEGAELDTVRTELWPEDRQKLIEIHESRRHSAMEQLVSSLPAGDLEYEIHLPRRSQSLAIRDLATDLAIDVLVMRADDVTSVPFLPIESAAETLMNAVPCSLMSVTPDGFAKPMAFEEPDMDPLRPSVAA